MRGPIHSFAQEDTCGVRTPPEASTMMALNPKSFLYTVDSASAVATITLNRPERLNALTFEVYTELRDTFRALDTEPGVRAVIITGTGRAFCTGGDVEDIIGALFSRDAAGLLEFTRLTGDLILSIRQCRRPVVAALNGTVAGAGAVIAAASDIRIAAESAKIAFLFSRVGLTGADMGVAWLLPRIVGLSHASELLMLGDFITAERAAEIGLYNRVVPGERLMAEATGFAARLARGPSVALGITKQALNQEAAMDLVSAIEWEAQAQAACMQNPNFREAYEAFRAKRDPKFE
jgi:enoyl-CoA hydratase/carnithine racemase